jgi:mRNA interferase MazF
MASTGNNAVKRGDVYWVNLDPTIGSEIRKTRPTVILSNDIQNKMGIRYVVGPITSQVKRVYPFEALVKVKGKKAKVLLDQIRTIDSKRLGKLINHLSAHELNDVGKALKLVLSI